MVSQTASKGVEIFVPIGFLTVDCGKCGGTDYKLRVLPQENRAKLLSVQCSKCNNILNLDSNRILEGKGVSSFSPLIKPVGVG